MEKRVIIPFEVFFNKGVDRWHREVIEAEGFRVYEMKPAKIYDLRRERTKRSKRV